MLIKLIFSWDHCISNLILIINSYKCDSSAVFEQHWYGNHMRLNNFENLIKSD